MYICSIQCMSLQEQNCVIALDGPLPVYFVDCKISCFKGFLLIQIVPSTVLLTIGEPVGISFFVCLFVFLGSGGLFPPQAP